MKSQKGFTPIFIIIIVVIAVVAGYLYVKQPWGPIDIGPIPAFSPAPSESAHPQKDCQTDKDCGVNEICGQSGPLEYDPVTKKTIEKKTCQGKDTVQPMTTSSQPTCEEINKRPTLPNAGISFEAAYCGGYGCNDAKNKADCESRDIVKVEGGNFAYGTDGQTDCKWVESYKTCAANK